MTVRVRYRGTELFPEGVVEEIHEANAYKRNDDGSVDLRAVWYEDEDEPNSRKKYATVGMLNHPESIVVTDDHYVTADDD